MDFNLIYKRIEGFIEDYFFPKNCLNCNLEGVWLCDNCKNSLFFLDKKKCPFCKETQILFSVCWYCKERIAISSVFSLYNYSDYLVQKIIKIIKYRHIKNIIIEMEPVFRAFLYKYKNLLIKGDLVIVPVPLTRYKKIERGFNQAEEMGKIIAKIINTPIDLDLVIKLRSTKNQAELEEIERYNNLDGAFKVIGNPPKNIIIIDDVFTTGSTVKEIAKVLKEKGVENIQVITLARG